MSVLFVQESDAVISVAANQCVVKSAGQVLQKIPLETLESITILGRASMTTPCVQEMLKKGISVTYFSAGGRYFGRLQSTEHVNTERQRRQCELYNTPFALDLSRRLVMAKIKNQSVVLRRYERSTGCSAGDAYGAMKLYRNKVQKAADIGQIMGYEGMAARIYFEGLSKLVMPDFRFQGRSRRPPKDAFNAMLSFGYYMLMTELHSIVEAKGLNPYFGFLHRDKEKHATLVSDMMEEWRAVLVDATVMSMVNGKEIHKQDFTVLKGKEKGCHFTPEGLKIFVAKLGNKMVGKSKYLSYVDYPVSFRQGIILQIDQLIKAMEAGQADLYKPIEIR